MSLATIANKEFDDAIRSTLLWFLAAIFVGSLGAVTVGYWLVAPQPLAPTLLVYLVELVRWLIPVTALVVGYGAVVGERETGTLRLLFGFPYTRWQVLFGKAIGRFAAVAAPVVTGLLLSLLLTAALYGRALPARFGVIIVTTVLLAAAFVSIAVAISALSRSPVRVVATAVAAFALFLFLWDLVPAATYFALTGTVPGSATPPNWFFLIERVSPVVCFFESTAAALPNVATSAPPGPFYLSGWFAVAILCAWTVGPLVVSYGVFRTVDLA